MSMHSCRGRHVENRLISISAAAGVGGGEWEFVSQSWPLTHSLWLLQGHKVDKLYSCLPLSLSPLYEEALQIASLKKRHAPFILNINRFWQVLKSWKPHNKHSWQCLQSHTSKLTVGCLYLSKHDVFMWWWFMLWWHGMNVQCIKRLLIGYNAIYLLYSKPKEM